MADPGGGCECPPELSQGSRALALREGGPIFSQNRHLTATEMP
jgi:hypothetical protein